MRSSAKEQMNAIKDRVVVRTSNGLPASPTGWARDGGDHINVASAGATQLGRALSLRYNRRFMHPLLGSFASVNNIWYFLLAETPSDEVRMINDHARLTELVKRTGGERRFVENFRAMLIHSVWVMLLNHPDLMRMMAESTLPFDCYRRMAAKALPERFKFTSWFVEGLNEVRAAVKERRRPKLESFLDRKSRNQENPYLYGEAIEWITGVPVDSQDRVDFDAYNESSWVNYDKFIAQEAAQKANKAAGKTKPEKKKFKVKDIDAVDTQPGPEVVPAETSVTQPADLPMPAEVDLGVQVEEAVVSEDVPPPVDDIMPSTVYVDEASATADCSIVAIVRDGDVVAVSEGVVHNV